MKKHLRKTICLLAACIMLMAATTVSFAQSGKVTYEGQADLFIFEPGSKYSKTDLFNEMYKGVMPGDHFYDTITVRNNASDKVDVEIFMRALGATDLVNPDDGEYDVTQQASSDFLEFINLKVVHEDGTLLFEEDANETAQLTDWVSLGKFKSGEEVDLNLELFVDYELTAQEQIGALDWQFKVIETPVPTETQTGDDMNLILPIALMGAAALTLIIVLATRRRKQEQ